MLLLLTEGMLNHTDSDELDFKVVQGHNLSSKLGTLVLINILDIMIKSFIYPQKVNCLFSLKNLEVSNKLTSVWSAQTILYSGIVLSTTTTDIFLLGLNQSSTRPLASEADPKKIKMKEFSCQSSSQSINQSINQFFSS